MKQGTPFDSSLRILSLRDHSEAELRRKLKEKGYEEAGIEESVARLRELGYLDDVRFARHFASSAIRNGRGYGARLKMELARRGVAAAIVAEVLAEIDEEHSEGELLGELMARRFSGFDAGCATDKEKRRVIGYLQRKGFSLAAILKQLQSKA
ncbi:regulatory protein RecX [Geomonas sp.]|uniref:regulatory protein RecX n=1 Tax=Geomonas sp. TaxID=2651584 RepID=UPI002B4A1782|nr:regulatory protein RecX [Geomonas sp.]HJV34394.1 regulatory protein RecX [Geomonas sp.]